MAIDCVYPARFGSVRLSSAPVILSMIRRLRAGDFEYDTSAQSR
jgi:hypothetical protein